MKVITRQGLAYTAPKRWTDQYERSPTPWHQDATRKLNELPLRKITPEAVNAIIGNESWTRVECDECGNDCESIIEIGQEPDYESSTAHVCLECLTDALALLARHQR